MRNGARKQTHRRESKPPITCCVDISLGEHNSDLSNERRFIDTVRNKAMDVAHIHRVTQRVCILAIAQQHTHVLIVIHQQDVEELAVHPR